MNFPIPHKSDNWLCNECSVVLPERHASCEEPCCHLVSWAANAMRQKVIMEANACPYKVEPNLDP